MRNLKKGLPMSQKRSHAHMVGYGYEYDSIQLDYGSTKVTTHAKNVSLQSVEDWHHKKDDYVQSVTWP